MQYFHIKLLKYKFFITYVKKNFYLFLDESVCISVFGCQSIISIKNTEMTWKWLELHYKLKGKFFKNFVFELFSLM